MLLTELLSTTRSGDPPSGVGVSGRGVSASGVGVSGGGVVLAGLMQIMMLSGPLDSDPARMNIFWCGGMMSRGEVACSGD